MDKRCLWNLDPFAWPVETTRPFTQLMGWISATWKSDRRLMGLSEKLETSLLLPRERAVHRTHFLLSILATLNSPSPPLNIFLARAVIVISFKEYVKEIKWANKPFECYPILYFSSVCWIRRLTCVVGAKKSIVRNKCIRLAASVQVPYL